MLAVAYSAFLIAGIILIGGMHLLKLCFYLGSVMLAVTGASDVSGPFMLVAIEQERRALSPLLASSQMSLINFKPT